MVDIVSDCVQNAGIALLLNNLKNVEIALFVVLLISQDVHCNTVQHVKVKIATKCQNINVAKTLMFQC
jgi:hypothetical protein